MKIQVEPEGREGIYIPDRESLIAWIEAQEFDAIHNFITGGVMIGADHDPASVIEDIRKADRVAIVTGDAYRQNMKHALAVINSKLELFDIGELTEADLDLSHRGNDT